MWRVTCMNINKKVQQYPIMYQKNEKYKIMGPKLSGQPTKESKKPIIQPEERKYMLLFVLGLQARKACPNYELVWARTGLLI